MHTYTSLQLYCLLVCVLWVDALPGRHCEHAPIPPRCFAYFVLDLPACYWNIYICMYCYCYHCSLFLLLFCLRLSLLLLSNSVYCNSLPRIAYSSARFRRLSDRLGCAAYCLLFAACCGLWLFGWGPFVVKFSLSFHSFRFQHPSVFRHSSRTLTNR